MKNAMKDTDQLKLDQYRDRWSSLGEMSGLVALSEQPSVAKLKEIDLFDDYDNKMLEKLSPDISLATWEPGTVLFEEGAYIDVAFYVVKGSVDIYLQGRRSPSAAAAPIFDQNRTMMIQTADLDLEKKPAPKPEKKKPTPQNTIFLSTMDFNLPAEDAVRLGSGDVFGEIGAMSGWPQSATAKTVTKCLLVQIRLPALRKMRQKSKAFKNKVDAIYRERSLLPQLRVTPLLTGCDDAFIESLAGKVDLVSCDPDQVIGAEGEPCDGLYIVRSGFVKLTQKVGEGELVVSYLPKGGTLGAAELLLEAGGSWIYTAASMENSELIRISESDLRDLMAKYPAARSRLWQAAVDLVKEAGGSRRDVSQSEFLESALEKGLLQGNSILVIDLDVCTRCDDCVRGCAQTHGGTPRFLREGDKYKGFLITRACNHCNDPVCLVGCPTGAIRRAAVGEVVEIVPDLCIGCRTCARNCPYDSIVMNDTGMKWPDSAAVPEAKRGTPQVLATKCDLCYTDPAGPACVRSCPQGCAVRVGGVDEFRKVVARET